MRLLITTGDFSQWPSRSFHYLLTELAKITDLSICYESGDINEIIEKRKLNPDFVFINEYGETNSPGITGLSSLNIPWAAYLYDLHYRVGQRKEALVRDNARYIFTHYRDKFYEWYPEFWDKMYWLPLHAYTEIFKDYGSPKDIDFLLMGNVHKVVYPLRYKIAEVMLKYPNFVQHEHPGHRNFNDNDDALVGEKFAREINRAKIFFTCDSKYHYPIPKYFEASACNTLLMASVSREIRDLGFEPGVHFVAIDDRNFEEKARYYLVHEEERLKIAKQGYEMVHSRHSTAQRAREMVNIIQNILND
ncbi:MAG: glycosyltransferase [Syntrophomonadaceae bacterium]